MREHAQHVVLRDLASMIPLGTSGGPIFTDADEVVGVVSMSVEGSGLHMHSAVRLGGALPGWLLARLAETDDA